jgi:hypothetical protein
MQNGRVRLTLTVEGSIDIRPELFRLAVARHWTLYELHQEGGGLEDLFRELTSAAPAGEAS